MMGKGVIMPHAKCKYLQKELSDLIVGALESKAHSCVGDSYRSVELCSFELYDLITNLQKENSNRMQ